MAIATSILARSAVRPGHCAFAHWKNVAILVWRQRAERVTSREALEFADQLMASYPLFSVIHIVEDTAGLPTPEGRDEMMAVARKSNHRIACIAVLLPPSNVVATLLRAFVRAVGTLLRGKLVLVVEQELGSLLRGVVDVHNRRSDVSINMSELASAIAETRALLARDV